MTPTHREMSMALAIVMGLITLRPAALHDFDNTRALNRVTLAFMRVRDLLPIPRGWL